MHSRDDFEETMRRRVEEMPRLRFVCERDVLAGPYDYAIGILWGRNFDAMPGEFIYRRRWLLRLKFRLSFERW